MYLAAEVLSDSLEFIGAIEIILSVYLSMLFDYLAVILHNL